MQRDIRFSFTVDDAENWSDAHVKEFEEQEKDGFFTYDDWVYDKMTTAMEQAGHKFMEENPDLFWGELI